MKYRWRLFWNKQISSGVGRFLNQFDKFYKLVKEGKHNTLKARYYKARMYTEIWYQEFCCLMLGDF